MTPLAATAANAALPLAEDREFAFTVGDFTRIARMVQDYAGIRLADSKRNMVYSRLARRLRARRLHSFADYIQLLERGDRAEWEAFINAITTNLTSFFREKHHFSILAEHIAKQGNRPVSIWSCAASTGEEPYSLAMTMVDHYRSFDAPVKILATDLDTTVLSTARKGVYPLERLNGFSESALKKHFLKGRGSFAGFARIRPELQALITFARQNLLDENWPIEEKFDAIFCRNVMIYFDKQTQYQILSKFVPLLRKDGLLFAGHSECFHHARDLFLPCGRTVYKLASPAS